jgi:soluble lytic murein transglycosylase
MRKSIVPILIFISLALFLLYFKTPLNILLPVMHRHTIEKYAALYNLDPLLITAIIKNESNFSESATSDKGAIGLMQLMPGTGRSLAAELGITDFKDSDLSNTAMNIRLGSYYVSKLLKEFKGNKILALAAYNAGETKVEVWYKENPLLEMDTAGIPYQETKDYVNSVLRTYRWLGKENGLKKIISGSSTT